ncbi:MAG: Gfo/Idh/MocA family oxidoreductase, partial [Planctomycetes bacterium]|nr:Gfo/Idh/MocA family oxidoreductase [Planctomycetota bacterium]
MTAEPLRVGVVGLGFMGRTHLGAYAATREPNRIVAVCDRDPARRRGELFDHGNLATEGGSFDPAEVAGYATPEELFADEDVQLVSICTHTPTHVPLAIAALEAGKHVLVEKPIALSSSSAQRLADAAAASDRICMPAMCMRFWPGWDTLLEAVHDERHGKLSSLVLRRLGVRPDWGAGFYADESAAGGAVFDLHVHDADLVLAALGAPQRVHSAGTRDHVVTRYDYGADGPLVVAEGGWDHGTGFPFRMGYTAVFERATLDYDLQRDPPLQRVKDGVCVSRDLPPGDGYRGEVRAFLRAVRSGDRTGLPTAVDAVAVTRLLEDE